MIKKLIVALSKNRQKEQKSIKLSDCKSILIRPLGSAIGDAAVHTAHLKQLKDALPNVTLGVLVTKYNSPIFEACGLVDIFIERKLSDYIKYHQKWDILLDFENNFNSASLIMDRIIDPKYIIIFRKYNKKKYNFSNIKNYDIHCIQEPNAPLSHFLSNSIFIEQLKLPEPRSILPKFGREYSIWEENSVRVLLCPQGSKRQLPETELAELLNKVSSKLSEEQKYRVEYLLSYTNNSEDYFQKLKSLSPDLKLKLSPKTSINDYFKLIDSSDIVVAVDGGSLHLACAYQKPLLSFFANAEPNLGQWTPLVSKDVPHLRLISLTNKNNDSNDTSNFDLTNGIHWLYEQISKSF